MSDRVVFVSMALCTSGGQPQPGGARGGNTIGHGMKPELQRIDATFFIQHRIAMKPRGDALRGCGVWQHIAGQLFDRKLVEWHVVVDGIHYPVAIGPD